MSSILPTTKQLQTAIESSCLDDAKKYFQAIVTAPRDCADQVNQLLAAVQELLVPNTAVSNLLVDIVWMQTSLYHPNPEGETASEGGKNDKKDNDEKTSHLVVMVQTLAQSLPALHPQWLACLDAPWLQTAGIIAKEDQLNKKMRWLNTQQYCRQHKFNLMSEVSEGYAKWISFVRHVPDNDKQDTSTAMQEKMKELIGTFSLDPNRCLDIALDALEDCLTGATALPAPNANIQLATITDIIRALHTDKITAILAFKLNKQSATTATATTTTTPSSSGKDNNTQKVLLQCVAYLFQNDLLDLVDMMTFFPEWFDPLRDTCREYRTRERKRIKDLGKVRLSAAASTTTPEDLEPGVDLSPLEQHATTQLIFVCLEWGLFAQIEDIFQECWSDLCQLFPVKVGRFICDWVERETQATFAALLPTVPWSKDDDNNDTEAMDVDTETIPAQVVTNIAKRLAYTNESGCIALRPTLYCQLWRMVANYLENGLAEDECTMFVENFLLPALGAFSSNPAINMEAWKAVSLFPCRQRYAFYGKWRGTGLGHDALSSEKPLWLVEGELLATKDAKYSLKRLSKDTIRETSRAIAKVSHGHPLVVFSNILSTIESYDNMIKVMVDSMRFVAPLSLDVLCFCILRRLSGSMGQVNRSRLKEDGVNVSQWLQSLETFIGALCRQFPSLEVRGIISYLILRLRKGEVMELGVLRTILKASGGWAFADPAQAAALSAVQLEGRAGSTLLKREIMSFGVFEDFSIRASVAIRKMLQSDNFGTTILILLAQVHHQIIFESRGPAKPIKLIGNLVDSCQATMAILLDFLADSAIERSAINGSPPDAALTFASSMPPLLDLIENFELDLSSLWMICRPLVRAAGCRKVDSHDKLGNFEIGETVRNAYMTRLPKKTWDAISCDLYESFYCLTLFDIFLPDDSYKTEISRLEREIDSKTKAKNENDTSELERMKKAMTELSSDWNKQRHHVESMRNELEEKTGSFFVSGNVSVDAMTTFFTACIFPRCMKGPDGALYCAHFISMLHSFETPGFGTLQLYDLIIVSLSRAVFGLTEGEAANVAILLESIWKTVSRWRYDEDSFTEELDSKIGSLVKLEGEELEASTPDSYALLYNKWHASLGAAMLGCLQSSEYMHCRNSLIVLSRMVEAYPTRPTLANRLLSALGPLQEESYPFADIRASAQAYGTQLIRARDDGVWKEETEASKKARKAIEQAAAVARQKKAEEQMEQMQRDSEKISEEIGERDSWDQRRQGPDRDRDQRRPARAPRRGEDDRRGVPGGPTPPREDRETKPRDDKWPRRDPSGDPGPPGGRRDESVRQLDDRWQRGSDVSRGVEASRGSKRSRGPSPVDYTDMARDDGPRSAKRQRTESEEGAIPDESGGRRGRKGRTSRR